MTATRKHDPIQGEIIHTYDGIEEADNALPLWWLATFFFTVAFGFVYFRLAPSTSAEYASEHASQLMAGGGEVDDDMLVALAQDSGTVQTGAATFQANCVVCHGAQAQGDIGPNLTDDHWLHGGAPTSIYTTVRDGVGARGMPQWGPVLGDRALKSVVAYVLTLRNTNVSGRPPEGEVYVPGTTAAAPTPSPTDAVATR
jgi:cytochrome c oxidase cbb3-type subunit 3